MNLKDLRYEVKFIADPMDNYISILLDTHPFGFREIFKERRVHNIYCDSELLSAYDENISGVSERVKVRYRWYEDVQSGLLTPIILELKFKQGKLGGKKFIPLKKRRDEISISEIVELGMRLSSDDLIGITSTYSIPSIYNSYIRTYYLSRDGKIRLTIDRNINFSPMYLESFQKGRTDIRPFSIIEVKGLPDDHQLISDFLKDFPYRPYRFSKYVVGIQNGIFS